MKNEQAELLASQTNANDQDNSNLNYNLIEREKIDNTPFYSVGMRDKGWFLIMGSHQITEEVATKQEALDKLKTEQYQIMMIMCTIVHKKIQELETIKTFAQPVKS